MAYLSTITRKTGGMTVHVVPVDKFKTTTMILRFAAPLDERVTHRALLSLVLKSATAKSPSTQELEARLDDLYGATLSSHLAKKGDTHILSMILTVPNEQYLSDAQPLFQQALTLLAEVVFHPFTENEAFDAQLTAQERRTLKQQLSSLYDDKIRYASQRLIDEMCRDEVYCLHTYGYGGQVDGVSPESLFATWRSMINEDQIDLYVVGPVEPDQVCRLVSEVFHFPERPKPFVFAGSHANGSHLPPHSGGRIATLSRQDVQIVVEKQAVSQGKLNLGFRTDIVHGHRLFDACQVFNGLFGVFPHSKLFMNVREKAHLAYYASSSYEGYKGLVIVMSGIEPANYDKAVNIIQKQLDELRQGRFSDAELAQTKALIRNALLESLDSPYAIVDVLHQNALTGLHETIDGRLKNLEAVSREDIIEVAQQTRLDTIFFLKSEAAA